MGYRAEEIAEAVAMCEQGQGRLDTLETIVHSWDIRAHKNTADHPARNTDTPR